MRSGHCITKLPGVRFQIKWIRLALMYLLLVYVVTQLSIVPYYSERALSFEAKVESRRLSPKTGGYPLKHASVIQRLFLVHLEGHKSTLLC
jgi:hypothetical protein